MHELVLFDSYFSVSCRFKRVNYFFCQKKKTKFVSFLLFVDYLLISISMKLFAINFSSPKIPIKEYNLENLDADWLTGKC